MALVLALVVTVAWKDRRAWRSVAALRGDRPTPPTVLVLTGLSVAVGLYLLQSCSPNRSSIRYLVPVWIFLPGLIASGLLAWRTPVRIIGAMSLVIFWGAAQVNLWADMNVPSPVRPLAEDLQRGGVPGIVAPTPVALLVADLTHGQIGAMEYQSYWPRLRDRYRDRFPAGRPIVCVVDPIHRRLAAENFGRMMRWLKQQHPGRVRLDRRVGPYEVWEADLPLDTILAQAPLRDGPQAGTIATTTAIDPPTPRMKDSSR